MGTEIEEPYFIRDADSILARPDFPINEGVEYLQGYSNGSKNTTAIIKFNKKGVPCSVTLLFKGEEKSRPPLVIRIGKASPGLGITKEGLIAAGIIEDNPEKLNKKKTNKTEFKLQKKIRIRLTSAGDVKLNIKAETDNPAIRPEFEHDVPQADAEAFFDLPESLFPRLRKTRYSYLGIDVDLFPNGKMIAEPEFQSVEAMEAFNANLPDWLKPDNAINLTPYDGLRNAFGNSSIAKRGFPIISWAFLDAHVTSLSYVPKERAHIPNQQMYALCFEG